MSAQDTAAPRLRAPQVESSRDPGRVLAGLGERRIDVGTAADHDAASLLDLSADRVRERARRAEHQPLPSVSRSRSPNRRGSARRVVDVSPLGRCAAPRSAGSAGSTRSARVRRVCRQRRAPRRPRLVQRLEVELRPREPQSYRRRRGPPRVPSGSRAGAAARRSRRIAFLPTLMRASAVRRCPAQPRAAGRRIGRERADPGFELHGLSQVLRVVGGRRGLLVRDERPGHVRDVGNAGGGSSFTLSTSSRNGPSAGSIICEWGVRRVQQGASMPERASSPTRRAIASRGPGTAHNPGAVDRGQLDAILEPGLELRGASGTAAMLPVACVQPGARRDDAQRVRASSRRPGARPRTHRCCGRALPRSTPRDIHHDERILDGEQRRLRSRVSSSSAPRARRAASVRSRPSSGSSRSAQASSASRNTGSSRWRSCAIPACWLPWPLNRNATGA